ncbi:MAG: winged helix-turn-helix transcriptional regulator [Candidatus Thorarchaeota archaeon]
MDSIDRGILLDLRRNCRITYSDLAEHHGITATAIRKRVASLEETGVIREYVVELSRAMVNSEIAFILIYTDKSIDDDSFANLVFEYPLVYQVHYDSFGTCIVLAEYSGIEQLSDLSTHLRRLESVRDMEVHTLPAPRGKNRPLTNLQLRVLAALLGDPKMRVSEIAEKSGLTVRRVRRILDELVNQESVLFTVTLAMSASDATFIAFRLTWDTKAITPEKIRETLQDRYPNEFYNLSYSALEPVMWCDFLLEHIKDAEPITSFFRSMPSVNLRNTIMVYPPKKIRRPRREALRKMIEQAGHL